MIQLSLGETVALDEIARRSGMDDWFFIPDTWTAPVRDIQGLIDGATEHDIETLTTEQNLAIMNLLARISKQKEK